MKCIKIYFYQTKIGGVCDTEPTVSNSQEESQKKQHKKKWKTRKGLAQRQTHQQVSG